MSLTADNTANAAVSVRSRSSPSPTPSAPACSSASFSPGVKSPCAVRARVSARRRDNLRTLAHAGCVSKQRAAPAAQR